MAKRDDFTKRTRNALALRAGYQCSFTDCQRTTVGPSDEASDKHTKIGVAAHISAAAPGGKRYTGSMTPVQRKHISNGIWLCRDHGTLIDEDEVRYTLAVLLKMKQDHEALIDLEVRGKSQKMVRSFELIAVGPEVVCTGRYVEIGQSEWLIRLEHFVVGDINALVGFIDRFGTMPENDKYMVINELGDGRTLTGAPVLRRVAEGYELRCPVATRFPRKNAQELQTTWATTEATNDIYAHNGNWAVVSGLDALPQRLCECLSLQRGESPFHPEAGGRVAEYFAEFSGTAFLARLVRLEVVRHAAIPYHDPLQNKVYTPFECVEGVGDVVVLAETPVNRRIPIRLDLDVRGVGRWTKDVMVFVEPSPHKGPAVAKRRKALDPESQQ